MRLATMFSSLAGSGSAMAVGFGVCFLLGNLLEVGSGLLGLRAAWLQWTHEAILSSFRRRTCYSGLNQFMVHQRYSRSTCGPPTSNVERHGDWGMKTGFKLHADSTATHPAICRISG